MKIVVADSIYLPEEYRRKLESLGELNVFDTIPDSMHEFTERIRNAEIVIVGRFGFPKEAFQAASNLRMIAVWQTGYDHIDIKTANEAEVVVTNVPGYAFDAVAELVFAFALSLLRKVHVADRKVREGKFDWKDYVGNELMGKTIGVLGTGNIGIRVIQIAHGFNMNILSVTRHPNPSKETRLGIKFVDMDTLLKESDIVTLHVPLTSKTEKMIGEAEINRMKSTAILINTARGKVVDEKALIAALKERKIRGAGLDVFENEPLPEDSPLMDLDNVMLTPHIAFLSEESLEECTYLCVENVEMFVKGKVQNVVNPEILKKE